MLKKFITLTAALLAAVLMTACGKSYDFSQYELTEAIGVKKDVFDDMDVNGGADEVDNEMLQQAMAMTGTDFYSYSFAHSDSDMEYDLIELTFSGSKVAGVSLSSISFEDFTYVPSEYSIFGICVGDTIADAEAKAEAYFGEKGKALSEDEEMWVLTDGEHDYISYGDMSGDTGFLQLIVNRNDDIVTKIEYSKF
ncbi:MAG: hypothetical protein J6K17_12420 [Oscillospiraceae bacterium]|nr:hypothetical protein [Oscillospiraceae bacterium]